MRTWQQVPKVIKTKPTPGQVNQVYLVLVFVHLILCNYHATGVLNREKTLRFLYGKTSLLGKKKNTNSFTDVLDGGKKCGVL